tara:strand:- start:374 stop:1291 length:918 start_codon:yes stop_codon:yes gene_type:complete
MSSIACVFPGQGSQHSEMLKTDLVDQSFINEKIDIVSEILSANVQSILDDESKLNLTSFTQPLLVLSSAIFSEAYKNLSLPEPKVIAGHSLGEYSALLFAESITFEDAIKITHLRGKLMENSEAGKMMAILGLDSKIIDELCSKINESNEKAYVVSANYNSLKQTVIAGNIKGIEIASNLLPGIGAKRCIELNVSIASHTKLMTDAAEEFNESLRKIVFSSPSYPIIQNHTGEIETDLSSIKQNLLNQLTKPVLWTKTMKKISNTASCLIEIGPKNILCGLSKGYDLQSILYMADLYLKDKVQNI